MVYDSQVNDGAGSILLTGGVQAHSTPNPFELNTLSSQSLTLDFSNPSIDATEPSATTAPNGGVQSLSSVRRQLRQLLAAGDAKLESRTWAKADRSDTPRVFYIAGPSVRYNDQTLESLVDGSGELLVRDETISIPSTQSSAATQPQAATPFSTKGTSLFRWKTRLEMTRQLDGTYLITMLDGIEVRHLAIDQSISTLTSDRLEATVARSASKASNPAKPRETAFDLGGSMDLRRLVANGGVYIDAPTRDIDCDALDYDYVASVASLDATPPRTVTVTTQGNPHPLRAQSVIWNIREDKITATNISGTAPR